MGSNTAARRPAPPYAWRSWVRISFEPFAAHVPSTGCPTDADSSSRRRVICPSGYRLRGSDAISSASSSANPRGAGRDIRWCSDERLPGAAGRRMARGRATRGGGWGPDVTASTSRIHRCGVPDQSFAPRDRRRLRGETRGRCRRHLDDGPHGHEVRGAETGGEPGRSRGRQDVVGRDAVVAERHRGPRTEERRAEAAHAREERVGVAQQQQEVLGREVVDRPRAACARSRTSTIAGVSRALRRRSPVCPARG